MTKIQWATERGMPWRRVRYIIARDPELRNKLQKIGYQPASHTLTPGQVRVLDQYLYAE
jgi:Domain of unknown function (DUF4248)